MIPMGEVVHSRRFLLQRRNWRRSLVLLRWQVLRCLVPRREVRTRGVRFTLSCDNWITQERWASFSKREPETLDWIDSSVKEGDLFFDIGANIGGFSLYAALRHPRVKVVAFEPEYANLHLLKDNIIENHLEKRVEVYSIALSNCTGMSFLHIQDFTPGASLHTESRQMLARTRTDQPVIWREGISSFTLDELCAHIGLSPNVMKIDVDGTEAEILEGAGQTLRSENLRSLLIEMPTQRRAHETCRKLLLAAGLQCQWRDRDPGVGSLNEVWSREYVTAKEKR